MKICVIGTGYVGLVTSACLADSGQQVVCIDKDGSKIDLLKQGKSPIHEPCLTGLLKKALQKNHIKFKSGFDDDALSAKIFFIAVGTPQAPLDGRPDLSQVFAVAEELGRKLAFAKTRGHKIIVVKSTVPPGTSRRVKKIIDGHIKGGIEFLDIVFNPEFLREGSAVKDTLYPDRIVLGVNSQRPVGTLKRLFSAMVKRPDPVFLLTDLNSAEMIKYASNAFLAAKISFINEISYLCELTGANINGVSKGLGLDKRIGRDFLNAGLGYGGSCFPKDTKALDHLAGDHGHVFHLLKAVIDVNNMQKKRFLNKMQQALNGLEGKIIAVLGLSFKPNTDDVRESIAIELIKDLLEKGARIKATDPLAESNARVFLPKDQRTLAFCDGPYDAAAGADALIIATEWPVYCWLNMKKLKKVMNAPIIFDGRNILNPKRVRENGFTYHAIGGHERG